MYLVYSTSNTGQGKTAGMRDRQGKKEFQELVKLELPLIYKVRICM